MPHGCHVHSSAIFLRPDANPLFNTHTPLVAYNILRIASLTSVTVFYRVTIVPVKDRNATRAAQCTIHCITFLRYVHVLSLNLFTLCFIILPFVLGSFSFSGYFFSSEQHRRIVIRPLTLDLGQRPPVPSSLLSLSTLYIIL